ncbi:glycosyltransferase [Periweissella cryptocerci]|uniref:Glycosyltransferase n=1 Tax=Periweissella cryptocerci TaxID=2506420 RepID=A0A4V1AID0_9LACO|nr:glycosyltransferase family 2 protein [Periweissella cryptocerci]QBO35075.1 glycosyltransferase [Periweissella cryptocerci]
MIIHLANGLNLFFIYYPIVMSFIWLVGALFFKLTHAPAKLVLVKPPSVAVIVPAYNESATIIEVVTALLKLNYANYQLILVNDQSTDDTLAKMQQLQLLHGENRIQIIDLPQNGGKARALNAALSMITTDYVYVVDADASTHPDALMWLVQRMETTPALGAATGRPIIRNRTSILGRVQTLEYLGIIGNIKEAQSFYFQQIMSISGVSALYRTQALQAIGGFDVQAMTEDIDATWRLYAAGWLVGYEPRAYTYILGPETMRGLFRQRSRWAVGGLEVLLKQLRTFTRQRWQGKAMLLDMLAGHLWMWLFVISIVQYVETCVLTQQLHLDGIVVSIYMVCGLLQFYVGMLQFRSSVQITLADLSVIPVYMFYYWLLNAMAALAAEFTLLFHKSGNGKWASPDRGL